MASNAESVSIHHESSDLMLPVGSNIFTIATLGIYATYIYYFMFSLVHDAYQYYILSLPLIYLIQLLFNLAIHDV